MPTTYRSFAKINLHLEVVGRRQDGYHELRTVFQTVSLCDLVGVELGGSSVELETGGLAVPGGRANLAHRAAEAYREIWGDGRGVRLRLDKRIPIEGGLGGGSSNAATVLSALRDLFGRPADVADLLAPAAALGADVPYFLVGGTVLGRGRGDDLEPLPDLDEEEVWLVKPEQGVSTREIFASDRLPARRRAHPRLAAVLRGEARLPSQVVGVNDLQDTILGLYEGVKDVYTALVQTDAEGVRVSGSGATVFAFRIGGASGVGGEDESDLLMSLPAGSRVFRVRTLSRRSIARWRIVESPEGR